MKRRIYFNEGSGGGDGAPSPEAISAFSAPEGMYETDSQSNQTIQVQAGFQGAQAPEGPQGAQGAEGAQGTQGTQGSGTQSAPGTQGSEGAQGAQGTQGTQGTYAFNSMWDEFGKRFGSEERPFNVPDYVKNGQFEEGVTELEMQIE